MRLAGVLWHMRGFAGMRVETSTKGRFAVKMRQKAFVKAESSLDCPALYHLN